MLLLGHAGCSLLHPKLYLVTGLTRVSGLEISLGKPGFALVPESLVRGNKGDTNRQLNGNVVLALGFAALGVTKPGLDWDSGRQLLPASLLNSEQRLNQLPPRGRSREALILNTTHQGLHQLSV